MEERPSKVQDFAWQLFGMECKLDFEVQCLLAAALLKACGDVCNTIQKEPSGKFNNPMAHPFVAKINMAMQWANVSPGVFDKWRNKITNGWISRNRLVLAVNHFPESRDGLNVTMDPRCFILGFNTVSSVVGTMQCE